MSDFPIKTLSGKSAVVVGGSSGIGLATAKAFAVNGAKVAICSRSQEKLDAAASVIGTNVLTRAFDGVDEKAMKSFVADVGRIDYLVIAAGGGGITGPFNSLDLAEFRRAFERKFWVQVNAAKIAGPAVESEGSITFVTGIFGLKALRNNSGVSAVNGAINAMVGPLAIEFAPVRVNAVSPGLVDSPYWDRLQPDARERLFEQRASNHLTGRVGKPDEVADFVLHVALNTFLCGAVIPLDGGFLLADRS